MTQAIKARHWNLLDCPSCAERVNVWVDKDGAFGDFMNPTAVRRHDCKPSAEALARIRARHLAALYDRGEL